MLRISKGLNPHPLSNLISSLQLGTLYVDFVLEYMGLLYWELDFRSCSHWAKMPLCTMLATSKNVLCPGHNHLLTTSADDPTL